MALQYRDSDRLQRVAITVRRNYDQRMGFGFPLVSYKETRTATVAVGKHDRAHRVGNAMRWN